MAKRRLVHTAFITIGIAAIAAGLLACTDRRSSFISPPVPLYNPSKIAEGGHVAGMTVQTVSKETHGKGSVAVLFQGHKEIAGRFEVYDTDTKAYNAGDVIFFADAPSDSLLPKPEPFRDTPAHFALRFPNETDKERFGMAGSTGTGTIVISDYLSVWAELLEGTSDRATFEQAKTLNVVPPPIPEENNPDFDREMRPFDELKLSPNEAIDNPGAVYAWIESVDKTFLGLAYNGKRISAAQRERIRTWLLGAFTETMAEELLDRHVPEVEGGYLIGGGLSGLKPALHIQRVQNPSFVKDGDGSYSFTVTYIASGTHDAVLTCSIVQLNGIWKIMKYEVKLI